MKVTFQQDIPFEAFNSFNAAAFPGRDTEKIINFRYFNRLNDGDFIQHNVIATDAMHNVIGQALYHPAHYFYDGAKHDMEWGFDFFVDPQKRNDAVGLQVLDFVKANKTKPIFASGVGKKALKIQKFYGYHVIGYLKKYFKIVNPLLLVTGFLRGKNIAASKFPATIKIGAAHFEKVSIRQLWNTDKPYNADLLEFERDEKFLKWRFCSDGFQYALYRRQDSDHYFAVRTIKFKRITCLVLADYRFDLNAEGQFAEIIAAASKVATALWLPIVVTGSSLAKADQILEHAGFKINGEDRPIVTNVKAYKSLQQDIKDRKFVFSTLADSDGEYLM